MGKREVKSKSANKFYYNIRNLQNTSKKRNTLRMPFTAEAI